MLMRISYVAASYPIVYEKEEGDYGQTQHKNQVKLVQMEFKNNVETKCSQDSG